MYLDVDKFFREVLLLFLPLYFAQGALYPTGSIIAKFILLIILLICFNYFVKTLLLRSKKPLFYYIVVIFISINVLGFIVSLDFNESKISQIKSILTALLPFFPFYYFSYKKIINKEHILRFFCIMLPITIWVFHSKTNLIINNRLSDNEDVVSNTSYLFVMLLPYIFLWKNKILSYFSLLLLIYFIIQGSKRGALLILFVGCLIFIVHQIYNTEPEKRFMTLVYTFLSSSLIGYFSYLFYISNDFFINRWQEVSSGASGRDVIYTNIFNNWYNSENILNFLFGYGFQSSIEYSGTNHLAHNDWLEVLINFGLFGFWVYLLLIISLLFVFFKIKNDYNYKFIILTILCIWFLKSMFSMYYMALSGALSFILIGYILGFCYSCRVR